MDARGEAVLRPRDVLVFRVAGGACALPLEAVEELVPYAELSRPPGLPSVVDGFLNLGGTAVAVLRLDRLFDLPAGRAGLSSLLIILRAEPPAALLADSATQILSPPKNAFAPIGERTFNNCAEAEIHIRGEVIHLLNPERVLLEKERSAIAELQARAQACLDELEAHRA